MTQYSLAFIITDLFTGGAEMTLYKLLKVIDRQRFTCRVITLRGGPLTEKIRDLGIEVRNLNMRPAFPNPLAFFRLVRWLSIERPQLVQTWMYHADLLGGLAARLAGKMPVVWGIRNYTLDPVALKRITLWTARLCAWLSPFLPARIVTNSSASQGVHERFGYQTAKMCVIPNGFDTQTFRPDPEARSSVREQLGISPHKLLIGLIARFDPMKDHKNFIDAAALLHVAMPQVHFLLCGDGITWRNNDITKWIDAQDMRQQFHLLGHRDDIPHLTAALDLATTSSSSEAFPNVIGEAMACGVPCVVTDVGDSHFVVGETGKVVPPRQPLALSTAWKEMLQMSPQQRQDLGAAARQRVQQFFSLAVVVKQYEDLYVKLITEELD